MAEVRVRLPLGALDSGRGKVWPVSNRTGLVLRGHEIVGSNPAILTELETHCGGARVGTGGRLLTASTQVRFLPPQLTEVIRLDEEPAPKAGAGDSSVVGSSPTASASGNNTCPWPSGKGSRFPTWRGGFDSRRALLQLGSVAQRQSGRLLSDSAWVRVPPVPLSIAGCLLVDRRGFEPRRRGFDSCTRNFDDDTNK